MKKTTFVCVIALSMMMLSCNQKNAVTPKDKAEVQPLPEGVTSIRLATELAKYGYENESSLALVGAADILIGVPIQTPNPEVSHEGEVSEITPKENTHSYEPTALLADARDLADQDVITLAMVNRTQMKLDNRSESQATRGATDGTIFYETDVVKAGTDIYQISFNGNEEAVVSVVGDGDTDLDLYVYDENGNLIVSDVDALDNCLVRFTPKWTGTFHIEIKNWGEVYNHYSLSIH